MLQLTAVPSVASGMFCLSWRKINCQADQGQNTSNKQAKLAQPEISQATGKPMAVSGIARLRVKAFWSINNTKFNKPKTPSAKACPISHNRLCLGWLCQKLKPTVLIACLLRKPKIATNRNPTRDKNPLCPSKAKAGRGELAKELASILADTVIVSTVTSKHRKIRRNNDADRK